MVLLFAVPGIVVGVTALISRVLFVITVIALVAVVVYFVGCWAVIGPVMIVERRFGMAALRRSRELVVGSWWRTVGILVTAGLIAGVPAAGLKKFLWAFIPVIGVILTAVTQAVSSTLAR